MTTFAEQVQKIDLITARQEAILASVTKVKGESASLLDKVATLEDTKVALEAELAALKQSGVAVPQSLIDAIQRNMDATTAVQVGITEVDSMVGDITPAP